MRIALVSYEYPPETGYGGIGTYVHQAAHMLAERGHEVEVFAGAKTESRSLEDGKVLLHRALPDERKDFHKAIAPVFAQRHQAKAFDIVEGPEFRADTLEHTAAISRFTDRYKITYAYFLTRPSFSRGEVNLLQKVRFMAGGLIRGKINKPYWTYDKTDDQEYHSAQLSPTILTSFFEFRRNCSGSLGHPSI